MVILRLVPSTGHFLLIGDAYVHGYMKGERVNGVEENIELEEFTLC